MVICLIQAKDLLLLWLDFFLARNNLLEFELENKVSVVFVHASWLGFQKDIVFKWIAEALVKLILPQI